MNGMLRIRRAVKFVERHRVGARVTGLITLTATVLALLLQAGAIRGCGEDNAIANGLSNTRDATTSEVSVAVAMRSPPMSYTAEARFDHQAGRSRIVFDFSGTEGQESATNVPMVIAGGILYMKLPPLRGVPAGRPWVKAQMSRVDELLRDLSVATGSDNASSDLDLLAHLDFTDPSRALRYLERSSDFEKVGQEDLFGISTSVYEGTLPIRAD